MSLEHGKLPEAPEDLQNLIAERQRDERRLLSELVSLGETLCNAMDAIEGFVPCDHAFGELIYGLTLLGTASAPVRLEEAIEAVQARAEHISDHRGVELGSKPDVFAELASFGPDSPNRVKLGVFCGLIAAAKYVYRAQQLGKSDTESNVTLARAAAFLAKSEIDLKEGLNLEKACGKALQTSLVASL